MDMLKTIIMFNNSAFGEIDIILDNNVDNDDWIDREDSVFREMHESALHCLQISDWLQELYDIKNTLKRHWWNFLNCHNKTK